MMFEAAFASDVRVECTCTASASDRVESQISDCSKKRAGSRGNGLGILVGDGQLPNPGSEKIIEMYYSFPVFSWRVTFGYQFAANLAYNRDCGPIAIIGTRLRAFLTSCSERSFLGPLHSMLADRHQSCSRAF